MTIKRKAVDANEAVAVAAYQLSEVVAITPSSPMGEWADPSSAEGNPNLWGSVPQVVEMQSEGEAAAPSTEPCKPGRCPRRSPRRRACC